MKPNADNTVANRQRILVVGISGRMVASLLAELGFSPTVIDFFADHDTKEICNGRVHRVSSFDEVLKLEQCFRKANAVVFAGGLEGAVDVAAQVEQWCVLASASPESLRRINDFKVFNESLSAAGLDEYPLLRLPDRSNQYFVRKQITKSGSGQRLYYPVGGLPRRSRFDFFQQWIEGESMSMLFVANGCDVQLLGMSRQLIDSLRWVGSVASESALSDRDMERALRFSKALVVNSGLRGVFGIDFVCNEDGAWPVDVNPRIPASAELYGSVVLRAHLAAFGFAEFESNGKSLDCVIAGKQVLFNTGNEPIQINSEIKTRFPMLHLGTNSPMQIADVPDPETVIQPGHPMLTVIATKGDLKGVVPMLVNAIKEINRDFVLEKP